jgi:hypothetical protein
MSEAGDHGPGPPEVAARHRKPPAHTRFRKGQSGNPAGRPPGRYRNAPHEAVLGQKVMIREAGRERQVSAAEAFLLHLARRGLEGDGAAARATIQAIEAARQARALVPTQPLTIVSVSYMHPGGVTLALEALRMARRLDPFRPTVRVMLEPWLVEAALARLGDTPLTPAQQRVILAATRAPRKVRWPRWWTQWP